jgi:hypothetical protein
MLNRADLVYEYDGSFHGLMCCVFESYVYQEIPADILSPIPSKPLCCSAV